MSDDKPVVPEQPSAANVGVETPAPPVTPDAEADADGAHLADEDVSPDPVVPSVDLADLMDADEIDPVPAPAVEPPAPVMPAAAPKPRALPDFDTLELYSANRVPVNGQYRGISYTVPPGGFLRVPAAAANHLCGVDNSGGVLTRAGVMVVMPEDERYEAAAEKAGVSVDEFVNKINEGRRQAALAFVPPTPVE